METIKLALQFLAASTPGPEPTPGGGGSSPVAQTGDFNLILFFIVLFVALAAVLTLFLAARSRMQGKTMKSTAANYAFKFATNTRLAIIGAIIVAAIALLCGATLVNAFAVQNEVNPDAVKVYVNEDTGVITSIDQGTYTNQTGKNVALQNIATEITSEAQSIEGLDQATMTAKVGEQIFYQGKIGTSYKPESVVTVANGQTITFTFEFKDLGSTIAKSLIGKTAIELSFAEAGYHTVTYNGNGATSGQPPAPAVKIDDTSVYISGNTGSLVKGEAKFNGWNTNAKGTGTSYVEGQEYKANEDLTLYAMYKEPTSDVTLTYKIVNEYQDMSHGSVALNSGGSADWQVAETFNPGSANPAGATATPKSSEENGKFGNWEFSHWSITKGAEEVCVSESANYVPTLETLGLTTWEDTTITAHFGMAAAVYDPNAETLTFKYTEDESVFDNTWAMPVYKNAHFDKKQEDIVLPSWFTADGTLQCYPRTAIIEKDFKHYKGITSLDLWFASSNTLASLFNEHSPAKNRVLDTVIGLENIDTSEVVSTVAMFADNCSKSARPASLVGETKTSFKSLDLSSWVTPNLKDTSYMFADCWNLQQVLLPTDQGTTTGAFGSTVENMDDMFLLCSSLTNLNISISFGSEARTTNDMFFCCSSLKTIDVANGNKFLSHCTECSNMFSGCGNLRKIDLSNLNVNNNTVKTDIEDALDGCYELRYVTVGVKTTWTNSSLTLNDMGLQNVDYDENGIWYSTDDGTEIAKKAEEIPAADFSKSAKVTTYRTLCSRAIYDEYASPKSLTFYYDHKVYDKVEFSIDTALNTGYMMEALERDAYEMYSKPIFPEWYNYTATADGKAISTYEIFNDSVSLVPNLDLKITLAIDAENVVFDPSFKNSNDLFSMAYFFMADSNGKQTFNTFSGWQNVNTDNIYSYACMFGGFSYKSIAQNSAVKSSWEFILTPELNHSELDGSLYINAYKNDTYSTSVKAIDISQLEIFPERSNKGFYRPRLSLDYMFANCTKLTNVTLPSIPKLNQDNDEKSKFPCSTNHMFENCSSLESVPSTLNGYFLVYAQYMFWNCSSLKTADLSGINVNTNNDWEDYGFNMFLGCNNLINLKTSEQWCWSMDYCGLIETWPWGESADVSNPWILNGKPIHVNNIPFDDNWDIVNHGTFTRGENTIGMAQATVTSADESRGTVSPSTINFVGNVVVLPLPDGSLKVGDTVLTANAKEGFELSFWTLNGAKITNSAINERLIMIDVTDNPADQFQAHFKKLNYTPKAVYNNTTKTMKMFYDDQTHVSEGTVFDINPNTYIRSVDLGGGGISHEIKWLPHNTDISDNVSSNNLYYGTWQWNAFEISLPTWYEFIQDNENQRFYINSLVEPETVVFDSTFAEYDELESISMWFMADSNNDQTIKTFKSVDSSGNELAPFANLNTTSIQNVEYAFGGLYLNRYFEFNKNQSPIGKLFSGDIFGDPADAVTYNSSYNTYGNSIENLDMSGFNFSNLKYMDWMFANCQGVKKITFDQNFDTSNSFSMVGMFNNCEKCEKIEGLNGDKVNTQKVEYMNNLFQGCSHLTSLDLSKFDTRNVYKNQEFIIIIEKGEEFRSPFTHNKMFLDCVRLNEIKIKSTYDQSENSWTGWTLYMDMCDLPSNSNLDDNWKVGGTGTSYSPFSIPLIKDANWPTHQKDLIQGTIKRTPPDIYKVNIKTADSSQGQIGYIDTLQDEWEYDYVNSINISTIQDAAAAEDAPAEFANEETTVAALYVDDRTYFAVPENGYELLKWTATWTDKKGVVHTKDLNNQGALYLTGDDKADVTVTASFKEKGAEAWALLSKDSNGNGYFSFRYDKGVYAPGTQLEITLNGAKLAETTVIKAYNVAPNHDDFAFPAWYDDDSITSYRDEDPHTYIPAIDEEFSNYSLDNNPLTIVFEDNFKKFDTLQSLSCFFMQATKESDGYSALVTPFAFDADHFKGLNNICMDNVWNVKYMFGGHEYFNDINGSKIFEEIDLTGLDMNHLNNLDAMFANCLNLKRITFPSDFTGSKITSLYKTFFNCDALYGNDLLQVLSQIKDTSKVTNMSYMFAKRHFDTTKKMPQNEAEDLDYIFPSSFSVVSVTNMTRMFAGNDFAKSINIKTKTSLFELFMGEQDNANAFTVDATGMFEGCTNLQTLTSDTNSWFGKISIRTAVNMFAYCYSLTDQVPAQLGEATFPDFSSCTDMYGMFQSCSNMTKFIPSTKTKKFDTSKVLYMDSMFSNSGLINFVVGNSQSPEKFDTTNVVEFNGMFSDCSQLQEVDLKRESLTNTKLIVDAENMFLNCYSIQNLTLKNIIFDSDENYNKSRYVPRTFKWDNDREDSSWAIASNGIHHPYSNMFSGLSNNIQTFEIDNNWNGYLSEPTNIAPVESGGKISLKIRDWDCAFPNNYFVGYNEYDEEMYMSLLWKLSNSDSHIIGEAGEITKKDELGNVYLPFGSGKFERVASPDNSFMSFDTWGHGYKITLTSPSVDLPDGFDIKFIDLHNCTSIKYQNVLVPDDTDQLYKIKLEVSYSDRANPYYYTVEAWNTGDSSRLRGATYISQWSLRNLNKYYEEPSILQINTDSWQDITIPEFSKDETYYFGLCYDIVRKTSQNEIDNNDNVNVAELNADEDAAASADEAFNAQADEGEDFAVDEAANSDDLLAKADDILQEIKDVCMWIFFLFVV